MPVDPKPTIPISPPIVADTATSDSISPSFYSNTLCNNSSAPTYTAERKHMIVNNKKQQQQQKQQQKEDEVPPKRLKVKSPTIEDMSNLSSCPSVITTPPTKPNRKNTPEYNIIKEPSTTHRENDIKPMTCKQDHQ